LEGGAVLLKEVRLAPLPESAAIARAEVVLTVRALKLPEDIRDRAELGVSETVTNGIVHAPGKPGSTLRLKFLRRADRLRIEVHDGSRALPHRRRPLEDDESGRGMPLLAYLADAYGAHLTSTGKAVWFELEVGRR
jgi:anti-sigma regulatory factor (Ser/Thr protein kinase)